MDARQWLAVLAMAVLVGCGQGTGSIDAGSDAGTSEQDAGPTDAGPDPLTDAGQPDAGSPPRFESDAVQGPAVWLKANLTDLKAPQLEVWARELPAVFGLAFHLNVDPTQLKLDVASTEPVMGPAGAYLRRIRGGDVAFALTRVGPAAGEANLTAETRLAVVQLSASASVDSRVTLDRVLVRTAEGAFVKVSVGGGRLVLPAGAK